MMVLLQLGPSWDGFKTYIVDIAKKAVTTKRRMMSIIGKFYDPIGFLSPVVIKFKVFFKELNLEWDEELSEELSYYTNGSY